MVVDGVVVVVEVNGMDKIDIGIEDSEGMTEDMVDFLYRTFANFFAKLSFDAGMAKVAKERVHSNYLETAVHNLEIVHKDIASYWVDEIAIALLELHNRVVLFLDSLHYPFGNLPLKLVMMRNLQ